VLQKGRYVVRARILLGDQLMFTSDTATPVITSGTPTSVSLMLRRVSGTQTGPGTGTPGAKVQPALDGTSWRATELAGKPAPPPSEKREATLVFQTGGRVSGFDGCNTLTGGYTLKDTDGISFGQMGATQKACLDSPETERGFRAALKSASRWRIDGGRLELFDAAGARVAAFAARSQASPPNANTLQGTRWQLVRFQGSDGTTLTPDDRGKYTIEFATGGRLNTRVDCNRGRGTWKSNGPQIEFGPLALSRAKCPPGSLHDQIVKQWTFIRSYVMKDGHLFLALMADGGIYEFEPLAASAPQTAKPQTPPRP
jgi:heat shock protein HslJ